MNKQRRNALHAVLDCLVKLRDPINKSIAVKILQKAQDDIQKCADDEEDALYNRPESLQWSAANDAMTDNVSNLNDASDLLSEIAEKCEATESFDYTAIEGDIIKVVNLIKQCIHR